MCNNPVSYVDMHQHMEYIRPLRHCQSGNYNRYFRSFNFSLLSYNILAQELLDKNHFLYNWSDELPLRWEYRRQLLLNEITKFNAHIICFQEVQESHLNWFLQNLEYLGYVGVFKKRTRFNSDGCAIFYKTSNFILKETVTVEYYQPEVDILDRDNIGIIMRFSPRINENENLVVATTHILFNPKRHDIKLAQVHLLLTEIERVSYKGLKIVDGVDVPVYHPIILSGDFNLVPNTAVYEFIVKGALNYNNRQKPSLLYQDSGKECPVMGKELIPKSLGITERSQHANILFVRKINNHKRLQNDVIYSKLHHSDRQCVQLPSEIISEYRFGTGNLYHDLGLSSVYSDDCCSTYQNKWIVVDYMFYTKKSLILEAYLRLPNYAECQPLLTMPNRVIPSDHLPLFAIFKLPFNS